MFQEFGNNIHLVSLQSYQKPTRLLYLLHYSRPNTILPPASSISSHGSTGQLPKCLGNLCAVLLVWLCPQLSPGELKPRPRGHVRHHHERLASDASAIQTKKYLITQLLLRSLDYPTKKQESLATLTWSGC